MMTAFPVSSLPLPLQQNISHISIQTPPHTEKRPTTRKPFDPAISKHKMCHTISHIHRQCGHPQKHEIIQLCSSSDHETCTLLPILVNQVDAPSLCISCFREVEASIDSLYESIVKANRASIACYEGTQEDKQIRGRAQGTCDDYVAALERELVEAREWRDRAIREFRSQQNVWADG